MDITIDQQVALDEALPFDKLPFEKEILAFIRVLGHSEEIKMITDEEHKAAKKSNEMYYPRFIKVIVNFFMTKDQSIPRRNKVNWYFARDDHMFTMIKLVSKHQNTQQYAAILPIELTNKAIRNSKSYKEYYAIALGVEPPKIKAIIKKKKSSFNTTMPSLTDKGKRLKTSAKVDKPAKEKQSAKTSKAKGLTVLSEVALTEAEQMKLATKRSLTQTHISHASRLGTDEGIGTIPEALDVPTYESDDEEISWKSIEDDDDDEVKISKHDDDVDDQSDDDNQDDDDDEQTVQIPSQVENTDDEDSHGMNVEGNEGANEEDDGNQLYGDVNINLEEFVCVASLCFEHAQPKSRYRLRDEAQAKNEDFLNKLDENIQKIIKEQVKEQVKTSYDVAADLSELKPKKILIDKMENNKSIHRSDEQKNLYKALVDDYEYEEPFTGSNQGSKRRQAGKELESTSAPKEKTSKTFGKSTEGSKYHSRLLASLHQQRRQSTLPKIWKNPHLKSLRQVQLMFNLEASQHPQWFQKQAKPPPPDRAWNKSLPTTHGWNLLEMSTLNVESSLSQSFKSLNGITTSIWIGSLYVEMMINSTNLKKGDFKRHRIQDIEDMLLLLVQGKLTSLTVDECFAFNVSLRMFTRSVVIETACKRSSIRCQKLPKEA
nr:hypothetical protein [Tanacetum cinerariifolium]